MMGVLMKILLIEDDVLVAEVFASGFAAEGHETTIAYSSDEGLTRLKQDQPDVVFLDVHLPKMSGIEVLRQIRSTDQTLPVIIITGMATEREMGEARKLGVTDIIEKPYFLKHLGEALARAVKKSGPA
jgi:CheY-like chemotaxis protein